MLSLYEILKASKTGIAPDMWTALAGMNWGGADSGHEIKELTGIPPLSFTADGTPLLDYLISGNMTQTGTPTPSSPIQPSECGDLETSGEKAGQYKIPISSANTTTPVYLGNVQTTRYIKKRIFDGTENWTVSRAGTENEYYAISGTAAIQGNGYSSHYIYRNITTSNTVEGMFVISTGGVRCRDKSFSSVADFKSFLAQQYANGTPVTVWYVLATPETGIVNEPIRKIGNYADTVSMEQAGVQILTLHGNTVIDVETELKPSEMYIKYQE